MSAKRTPKTPKPKPVAPSVPLDVNGKPRPQPSDYDGGFEQFRQAVCKAFVAACVSGPLFRTDATKLSDTFLHALPEQLRQHYTCRHCVHFFERYGGLVTIDDAGHLHTAVWPDDQSVPVTFDPVVRLLRQQVESAKVVGAFVTSEAALGAATTGPWTHLSLEVPPSCCYHNVLKTSDQREAELLEDMGMLTRGLAEFNQVVVGKALALLRSGGLERPEKGEPMADWLLHLQDRLARRPPSNVKENLLWAAVAAAPTGFCHVRSSVLGTLLQDVLAGSSLVSTQRSWAAKVDPSKYMRAQVAPAAGNLKQAEGVIQKMEAAGSLRRRYATRADVQETVWSRRCEVCDSTSLCDADQHLSHGRSGPVFGHIVPKAKPRANVQDLPAVKMTLDKFRRIMLPTADRIEWLVPEVPSQFAALVTAADPAAPPILQWDHVERRNQTSIYSAQSAACFWNLTANHWAPVSFIAQMPYHWAGNSAPNHKEGLLLALEGCRDAARTAGGGFLSEFLLGDLRPVRTSLDAYARAAKVEGVELSEASGLALMRTEDVAGAAPSDGSDTDVILVIDESGSMTSKLRQINAQGEKIRVRLGQDMPKAMVKVIRFGSSAVWSGPWSARDMPPQRFGSDRGMTSLYRTIVLATSAALIAQRPTLIYVLTDGEATDSDLKPQAHAQVSRATASGLVTFVGVGPSGAATFFRDCGLTGNVRSWDGNSTKDLDAVTDEVASGISAYARARSSGATSVDNFFGAPTSGFGAGVRLRVTSGSSRQEVVLDRWD